MRILSTGSALPKLTLRNDSLTEFLDTSDEWIRTRTGICSRQVLTDESLLELGTAAAQRALDMGCLSASDVDFLLCTTVRGDMVTPSMGCLLQAALGASCPALDLNGACAGFVYALDIADALLRAGKAQRVLIVSVEGMTRLVDWADRSTCVLFGDGAGAVVVDGGEGFFRAHLTSSGNAVPLNILPDPGNSPFAIHPEAARSLYMDGQEIYKFAVSHSAGDLQFLARVCGLEMDQISHFLLHQANKRIVDAVRSRLRQPEDKFPTNVAIRGNTSSASLPILLDEENRKGRFHPGDLIAMSAFGAGLTTGACILEWASGGAFCP